MAQAITMQAQAMTAQVNRQDVQRENPPVRSMADRLRDFTRMNPPIFAGVKTSEDPQEFINELHKILVAMGATDIEKAELRNTTPRGGRPDPKRGNGGEMQRPKKTCTKCGRAHIGECRQGTNACFGCGKSGHLVRDCPQNNGQAGVMLSLGLPHRVQQQPSLPRGTDFMP
ncbi:uncharacterized protein LOC107019258 [Solanum pennellii]|uniref:Uncharacterized protein LOC107019258 n=1 Tax=Solanum pennellii TaxID=28526 RepID=A0ABM1GSL2_SOLPN|nr:uncharacterized protein LOC107019258 [Solanum pennellii]